MQIGSRSGREVGLRWGISAFVDDEGGHTSVAVACALLVSLALVFSLAQVQWMAARSADVQAVADACALSGARAVRAFSTVAQVVDATVLSLGVCGLTVLGAGIVTGLVPGMGAAGVSVADAGRSILQGRRELASSASEGLKALEAALPAAVASNGWATAGANGAGSVRYAGVALAFPAESRSVWTQVGDVDDAALAGAADDAAGLSDEAAERRREADAALEAGWRADCVDAPSCLWGRASSLAGLPAVENPRHLHMEGWNFGVPLLRARAYYAARLAAEAPDGDGAAAQADSARRRAYYAYALAEVRSGEYRENADGTVVVRLPRLAHDAATTRASDLFDTVRWPCTSEGGSLRLHAFDGCPGARGQRMDDATVAQGEAGGWQVCPDCDMGLVSLSRVASASTNTSSGFEHYWRLVCDAAEAWEPARNACAELDGRLREVAEGGADLFERALAQLAVARPRLCPPGAYGCIGVVAAAGSAVPSGLAGPFAGEASLPGRVAMAAATLAPDDTERSGMLRRFFDGASGGSGGGVAGVLGGVTALWGQLLEGYGDAYGAVADAARRLFDGLDAVGAGGVARWLGDRLSQVVAAAGLEPADLRLRKPVLCHTQEVLDKDGSTDAAWIRRGIQALPADGTPAEMLAAFGRQVADVAGETEVDLGELSVPGLPFKIPVKVRLSTLLGGAS